MQFMLNLIKNLDFITVILFLEISVRFEVNQQVLK